MKATVGLAAALLMGLGLAGCGNDDKPATAPPAPTSSSAGPKTFAAVAELKDAAVAAGLPCPNWNQDNVVEVAAESGTCSDEIVLSTYATQADLQEALGNLRSMSQLMREKKIEPTPLLIGPNWIINAAGAPDLTGALGGTIER